MMHHDCKRKNKNTRAKGGKEGAWCLSLQLFPGSDRVLQICFSGARRALLKGLSFWFFLDQVSSPLLSFPDMLTIISVYILAHIGNPKLQVTSSTFLESPLTDTGRCNACTLVPVLVT
ncbi:unnamed protein product [Sphagnum jensenii]|uniref:Uncharacterized protein n=1 Tax=Sphagnum jensenii TaxID=128206 RepID=A0ABP1AN53_9BRYO